MRGPLAVLLLFVGWAIMYFLLMGAIPEHQREQTDKMPGTQKAAPLVRSAPAAPKPVEPAPPGDTDQEPEPSAEPAPVQKPDGARPPGQDEAR